MSAENENSCFLRSFESKNMGSDYQPMVALITIIFNHKTQLNIIGQLEVIFSSTQNVYIVSGA